MASMVNYTYQASVIIKDYGTTTQAEQELFKDKYANCKVIYGGTLSSDKDCEYIALGSNGKTSKIKLKAGEVFEFSNVSPFVSLKIKAVVGTVYNFSVDC